ncbi:MAG: FecR domain-containing protein [Pirellulaceae bacterium]
MDAVEKLIARYLDQRESLDDAEIAQLAAAAGESPEVARALKRQLVVEELLGQRLAVDRQGFEAQVEQRLHDIQCGQRQLAEQAAQLRQLAESQLEAMPGEVRRRRRYRWLISLAASMLLVAGAAYGYWNLRLVQPLATIVAVEGDVWRVDADRWKAMWASAANTEGSILGTMLGEVSAEADQIAATSTEPIMHGEGFLVGDGGRMQLQYADGTRVTVRGRTMVGFAARGWTFAKTVHLAEGQVTAKVAKQGGRGAMEFETASAVARVLGTELSLRANGRATRLDVYEGRVQLVRRADGKTALVQADEVGVATADELTVEPIQWPLFRDGLIARMDAGFDARPRIILPMQGETELPLVAHGLAWPGRNGALTLAGGGFTAEDAGRHLVDAIRRTRQWTLELLLEPKSLAVAESAALFALQSDDGTEALAITQFGSSLYLRLAGDAKPADSDDSSSLGRRIADLPEVRPYHLAIRFRDGELVVLLNGEQLPVQAGVSCDWERWSASRLVLGSAEADEHHWLGTISHLAIYNRYVVDDDLRRQAASAMRFFRRMTPQRVLVRAVPTSPPRIARRGRGESAPSLVVRDFRVLEEVVGKLSEARFTAAYWDVLDSQHAALLPAAEAERIFVLEPLADYPHVARQLDSTGESASDSPASSTAATHFVVEWQ